VSQSPIDPDPLLDVIIARLQQQAVPPMPPSLIEPAAPTAGGTKGLLGRKRRWILRRAVQVFAAALAVVAVALCVAIGLLHERTSFAFGDVQKAVGAAKSMTYQCSMAKGNEKPIVVKVSLLGGDRSRADRSDGEVQILNRKEGAMMTLTSARRTAVIQSIYPSPELAKTMTDWLVRFRDLPAKASRRIGERENQGRRVIDFLVNLDEREYTVTVDARTRLPVRMEFSTANLPATGQPYRELWTDFVFDAPLDESLFALTATSGYTVQRLTLPTGTPPDDRFLVVSPETGIGPVRFGMNEAQIVKLLGKPDRVASSESTMPPQTKTGRYSKPQTYVSTSLSYDLRGFTLDISSSFRIGGVSYPGYGLLGIRVFNQVDRLPTARDFQGITKEGIRLGATPDQVLKVYGKPDQQPDLGGLLAALSYVKRGWMFEFRHGKLASIHVQSPLPADQLRSFSKTYTKLPVPARGR
jgi:hypothetical protein